LPGDLQPELVEPAERRQIGRPEGQTNSQIRTAGADVRTSVGHVEVFRMGGVGTFILGRPRPVSSHRRADTANEAITPSSVKSPIRAWPTSIFWPLPAAHQARWLPREAARVSSQRRFNPANPNSASSVRGRQSPSACRSGLHHVEPADKSPYNTASLRIDECQQHRPGHRRHRQQQDRRQTHWAILGRRVLFRHRQQTSRHL